MRPLTLLATLQVAALMFGAACTGSVISGHSGAELPPHDVVADADGDVITDADHGGETTDPDVADGVETDAGDAGPDVPVVEPDWTLSSLGDLGVIGHVYAVSPKEAYAAAGPRVLRYNGRTWATFGSPLGVDTEQNVHAVWSDGSVVIAVGDGGAIARRVKGELAWTLDTVPSDADLHGIYGRSGDDIWAVGSRTTLLHWDGSTWTEEHSGDGLTLHAVWAPEGTTGPDDVVAVGTKGRLLRYKEGGFGPTQIAAGSVNLYAIWGAGEALFAVGSEATITMKASPSASWQGQASNDTQDRDLFGIVAASADNVVAVGVSGAIIRYDGDKWNVELGQSPTYGSANYRAISYAGAGESAWLVVAAEGGGVRFDPQAEGWVDMHTRPESELRHIVGDTQLWAVGRTGLLMTELPQTGWTAVDSELEVDLNDVALATDGTVWAVGGAGTVLQRSPDGTLTQHSLPVPVSLFGVAVSDTEIVVAGKGGTLLSAATGGAAMAFTPRASGTPSDLKAATYGGDGALWLAGAFGSLLRSEGGATPVPVATGVGGSLNTIAATANGVMVAGDNGVIIEATAAGAELLYEQPGLFLYGLSTGAGAAFAVGWNGSVLRIQGQTVSAEVSGTNAVLEAVWHDGTRAVATGRQGVLITRLEAP